MVMTRSKRRLTQMRRERNARDDAIERLYLSGNYTTERIAEWHNLTPRSVQRMLSKRGTIRSRAHSNRLMAKHKRYTRMPAELRAKRKRISNRLRYELLAEHPYCALCGAEPSPGVFLQIDHIDDDATNNDRTNLQVLCRSCNHGKGSVKQNARKHLRLAS